MRTQAFILTAALALTAASPALAEESAFREPHALLDRSAQERHPELSFWAFVPWFYGVGVGVGARFAIPLVKNGFISELNNSVELEVGGDVAWEPGLGVTVFGCSTNYSLFLFDAAAEGRWTFHLTGKVAVYGKVGVALAYGASSYNGVCGGGYGTGIYVIPIAGPGVIYNLSDKFTLRAEVGTHGLRGGFGIAF